MDVTLPEWCHNRPSTTIVGSFRPDIVAGPGYRKAGDGPRQNAPGSVETTVEQRTAIQGYPPPFRFAGSKGKVNLQLGNAMPTGLALACLKELWHD